MVVTGILLNNSLHLAMIRGIHTWSETFGQHAKHFSVPQGRKNFT